MSTCTITFRTEQDNRDRLDEIAEALDRNRNWIINRALDQYVEQYDWELRQIDEGIADVEAGRIISAEEFKAYWAKKLRSSTKKKAKTKVK